MAKILFIAAQVGFRDEELLQPKEILKDHQIFIASKTLSTARGVLGHEIKPDLTLEEALKKVDEFEAIIYVGGPGAEAYLKDYAALELVKKAYESEKVKILAAICLSPLILAEGGVLKGKQATVWDPGDKTNIRKLELKGAKFVDKNVVQDGKLITANGPGAAKEFGILIAKNLK